MSANLLLPAADLEDEKKLRVPESPTYHKDQDEDEAEAVENAFTSTPPPAEEPPKKQRHPVAQKQPKSVAAPSATRQPSADLIAAQRKNATPVAKRTAALIEAKRADPDAPKKRKHVAAAKASKKDVAAAKPKAKKARKPRISFTPESRQPGKRAPTDTRPRRAVSLIDDEDDDDFDGAVGSQDDDDEEEEEDVVADEGGAIGLDDVEEDDAETEAEDDNATVAISNPLDDGDGDARLMSSTRPKSRANAIRGNPDLAIARRIAAIESDLDSDVDVAAPAPAAAKSKSKRKKAAVDESVATVEKSAAKSRRRAASEKAPAGEDPYDIDAVLQKNAKKFKLVSRSASEPLTTASVRKEVSRKARDGQTAKLVYRLLQLDRTKRCAYSRAELMQVNKEGTPRIDMDNFLHFAAVEDGKYKMEDVMSFLVDKNDMMCACPRRTLLPLLYLDQNLDYAHFRDFYNKLPEYIDMNNDEKIPPVPPAVYTGGEIRKSKPSCPSSAKMNQWTQPLLSGKSGGGGGGGGGDEDDFQSVVPATEFDGDDVRSVATSKHPKAASSSRPPRVTQPQPPPHPQPPASFGVYTNVDLASPVYRGLDLVSRSYGPGTQLPLATFVGNPMARLLLEFGPMCPTEQHAVYFAHLIRSQLAANGAAVDSMIREVHPPPVAAAAAAAPAHDE